MAIFVAMLRGVNVGGNHKMPMAQLRTLCESLNFTRPETFLQSGNIVFESPDGPQASDCLEAAIEKEFGFRSAVILRTAPELRGLISRNPFQDRERAKVLVTFLKDDPGEAIREAVRAIPIEPEELFFGGREMFWHHPNGQGKSKAPMVKMERMLGCATTTRNWNGVEKLLEMAERR